jgi:hypothetical protein
VAKTGDKKKRPVPAEGPVDFASRIGGRADESSSPQVAPEPATPEPADSEPTVQAPSLERPHVIGGDEPRPQARGDATGEEDASKTAPIVSVRGAPAFGEVDLVVTPLPTPDDWHRFELALRKIRGVTQLRPEYYRHGVAKMRVSWEGTSRLATALRAGIPGYRVRIIGEDRATIQILVSSEADDRRPG